MRKAIIWITVVALIVSIVGTGVIVFTQTSTPIPVESTPLISGENAE